MKKLLLSLAVIAASGAYVVVENRADTAQPDGGVAANFIAPATALQTKAAPASAPQPQPAAAAIPPVPAPIAGLSSLDASQAAPAVPADAHVDVADISPLQFAAAPQTASDAPPAASIPPPPAPRPADAPQATAQVAQAASSASGYVDGTYLGSSANAYYGRVQVSAVIQGGKIEKINVLQYPNDRRTSRYINGQALPMLEHEVIQAQSGNIDTVSGATLTSEAYIQSLGVALGKAGGGHA